MRLNSLHSQTFGDENGEYRINDLLQLIKRKGIKAIPLPIASLKTSMDSTSGDEVAGSPEFNQRMGSADLSFPVILVQYPHGLEIADGWHRAHKAFQTGQDNINAYIIPHELIRWLYGR